MAARRIVPSHVFGSDVVVPGDRERSGNKKENDHTNLNGPLDSHDIRSSSMESYRLLSDQTNKGTLPPDHGLGGVSVHCPEVSCAGGAGGIAHGSFTKSKNSLISICAASRFVSAGRLN